MRRHGWTARRDWLPPERASATRCSLQPSAFRLVFVLIDDRHYDQARDRPNAAAALTGYWMKRVIDRPCRCGVGDLAARYRSLIASNDPPTLSYSYLERDRLSCRAPSGEGRNEYNNAVGTANVGHVKKLPLHVELGDAGRALRARKYRWQLPVVSRDDAPG